MHLVDPVGQLGTCIDFAIPEENWQDYLNHNKIPGISSAKMTKVFKKDLCVDIVVDRVDNADIYYFELPGTRDDEVYYFGDHGKLFHGERIWSLYHRFLLQNLNAIQPTAYIDERCWFAGSRNNYTHQLLDFFPNILYQTKFIERNSGILIDKTVFGKKNGILNSAIMHNSVSCKGYENAIYLSEFGTPIMIHGWRARCIRVKTIFIVKHMSIFRSYSLLAEHFAAPGALQSSDPPTKDLLFLARKDTRVRNQTEIVESLSRSWNTEVVDTLERLSFSEKRKLFDSYRCVVTPPGSDNINAFCFSNPLSRIVQLSPVCSDMVLDSPFYSYAGLRYALPFLDRYLLVEKSGRGDNGAPDLSGEWDPSDVHAAVEKSFKLQ